MQANTNQDHDPRFENIPFGNSRSSAYGQANIARGQDHDSQQATKKFRLNISQRLNNTVILAFVAYLILLTSFAAPYWLSSYKFTDSNFKRLGLWDFCFRNYRHPSFQYDTKFTGCHWVYSSIFINVRDWLQPPWFMFVQATITIALCVETLALVAISFIIMQFLIQYLLIILCINLLCHMFTTMLIAFATLTFYLKAFDRNWILYPHFNHVDWAFFFAIISMLGNGVVSYLYYQEIQDLKTKMIKMKRLVVATSNNRPMGAAGGDVDSIDAVYATRSGSIANDYLTANRQSQYGNKELQATMYPQFTQV